MYEKMDEMVEGTVLMSTSTVDSPSPYGRTNQDVAERGSEQQLGSSARKRQQTKSMRVQSTKGAVGGAEGTEHYSSPPPPACRPLPVSCCLRAPADVAATLHTYHCIAARPAPGHGCQSARCGRSAQAAPPTRTLGPASVQPGVRCLPTLPPTYRPDRRSPSNGSCAQRASPLFFAHLAGGYQISARRPI